MRTVSSAERSIEPHWTAVNESAHILAANQRDVLAELLLVKLEQAATMARLFHSHFFKYGGGGWKVLAEAIGKVGIDAFVFFFEPMASARISRSVRLLKSRIR